MYNIGAYILFLPIPSPIAIGRWWRGEEDDGCASRRRLITCRSAWKTLPAPCSWEINMCLHVIQCILRARINRHFITWENIMITILCRQPAQYRPAEWVDGNKRTAIIPLPPSSTRKPQSIYQMKHVEGNLSLSLFLHFLPHIAADFILNLHRSAESIASLNKWIASVFYHTSLLPPISCSVHNSVIVPSLSSPLQTTQANV